MESSICAGIREDLPKLIDQDPNPRLPVILFGMSPNRSAVPSLAKCLPERAAQCIVVIESHYRPEFRPAHDLGIAADIRRNDRQAAGHRFQQYVRPTLVTGRQHEYVGSRQGANDTLAGKRTQEANRLTQAQVANLLPQLPRVVALRSARADDDVVQITELPKKCRHARNDAVKPFALGQRAHGDEHLRPWRDTQD